MRRRVLLAWLLLPGGAMAQGEPVPAAPAEAPPRPRPRPRPPRRDPADGAYAGGGMIVEGRPSDPRGEPAPLPNLGIEDRRVTVKPAPEVRLTPGIMAPSTPDRGATSRERTLEELEAGQFKAAPSTGHLRPGVHLRVPIGP